MTPTRLLRIDGDVGRPIDLTLGDLDALPESERVRDVSRFHPSRKGDGVRLEAVLRLASPSPEARYLTLHAARDDFHVSIPLEAVRESGVIVYRVGSSPMTAEQGGPVRFLIPDPAACHTDELDDCANVKYLDRIELSAEKGRDTRPHDEAAHEALHAREGS